MAKLIMLVVVLLLVLLLAAGGLIYFKIIPDITGMIQPPPAKTAAQGATPEVVEAPPLVDPEYYDISPLTIPIIRDSQVASSVYVAFRLVIVPGKHDLIESHVAQLHDVYIRALFRELANEFADRKTPDIRAIKKYMFEVTNRVVGEGSVKDVLIESVFMR